jgi:hypothetical protein
MDIGLQSINSKAFYAYSVSLATIFLTGGAINKILGNAIGQASANECSHCAIKFGVKPKCIAVSTPDISSAISSDIKNANNRFECLALIFMI